MVLVSVPEAQTRSRYRKTTGWLGWTSTIWFGVRWAGCRNCPASGNKTNASTLAPSREGWYPSIMYPIILTRPEPSSRRSRSGHPIGTAPLSSICPAGFSSERSLRISIPTKTTARSIGNARAHIIAQSVRVSCFCVTDSPRFGMILHPRADDKYHVPLRHELFDERTLSSDVKTLSSRVRIADYSSYNALVQPGGGPRTAGIETAHGESRPPVEIYPVA